MDRNKEITEQREVRTMVTELHLEKRADGEGGSRTISGYAAVFDSWSERLYSFKERIDRMAFDDSDMSDCILCFNHDENEIMARTSSGTLKLTVDNKGLKFEAELPNTTRGNDLLELVRRGDINACSFAFVIEEDSWNYTDDNELDERTILKVKKVYDVCPVVHPAYKDTSCDVRSLEERKRKWMEERNRPDAAAVESQSRERQFQMLGLEQ